MADGKQPYSSARRDGAPLAFASLWEGWRDQCGDTLRTFTMMTTSANDDMAPLHNRIPAILEYDDGPPWLGEVEGDHAAPLRPAAAGTAKL